jgi:hypothetical protein
VLEKLGEYPYKLLRMASASSGALDQSLRSGHIEMNDWGALTIKRGTKGLLETLKPLGGDGSLPRVGRRQPCRTPPGRGPRAQLHEGRDRRA